MATNSRTQNSLKNSFVSIIYNFLIIIISFVAQTIFIKTLGTEYNGIKSLFLNLLNMLSIVELGFGTAIVYNLYKPLSENNEEEIKTIINFYKKVYIIISVIIFILGLLVSTTIPYIVGETAIKENIYVVFILFLLNSVASYCFSYKRSILYADQKNYIINIVEIIFNIIKNTVQIVILLLYKNFLLYLIIQIIMTILNNIAISIVANRKYPYLKKIKNSETINSDTKKEILNKVKGLLFHKLGGFFVTGTDNILISTTKGLGIVYVGYYANYNMVISNVALIFSAMINSITASVGNLLINKSNDKEKKINTYKAIVLINSWIYCFGMISIYILIEPFIKLWLGKDFLLSNVTLIVLVINFYINGIKQASNVFKEAAGVFYEDRFVPILESIINLIFSILFAKFWGLPGIFIGTICSSLVLLLYSYPKFVYKGILKDKIINYFKLHITYTIICTLVFIVMLVLNMFLSFNSLIIEFFIKGIICIIVPNLLYFVIIKKTKSFQYLKKMLFNKKGNSDKK